MGRPKRKNVSSQKLKRYLKKRAQKRTKLIQKGRLTLEQLQQQSKASTKVVKKSQGK